MHAAISPYRETRDQARSTIGDFVEVYLKCPLEVLIQTDVKGLYTRALRGEIPNFTGVSDPYEEPVNPDVVLETDRETVEESLNKVLTILERKGYLPRYERRPRRPESCLLKEVASTNDTGSPTGNTA